MVQSLQQAAVVACLAGLVMFSNLGGPLLWDRDEPRNAGCAREMQQRGDWVTPVFNGELRAHKPVLLYWLMMVAYATFGVGEFAARFWSATLAVGTALCTYSIGRRLFHPNAGLWAGIAVASSLLFGVAGRAATPDSVVIFLSTLSIAIYVHGTFKARRAIEAEPVAPTQLRVAGIWFPSSHAVVVGMYAAMALGVLAKGPVGLVLPMSVIGMFLLIVRLPAASSTSTAGIQLPVLLRAFAPGHFLRTCWAMRPCTALLVTLVVAAPWYIWVGMRTDGEFLRGFFMDHNFGRALQPMEGHDGGILFYPGAILVGFFPWSVLALPVLVDLVVRMRRGDSWRPGYLLAACWVGVYVMLFSLAKTKLPSYVTPCYPGLALITGSFAFHWTRKKAIGSAHWRRLALGVLALIGLALVIGLPIAAHRFVPGEEWLGAIGLIPLLGGLLAWFLMERGLQRAAVSVFAGSAVLLTTLAFGMVAQRVSRQQQIPQLLAAIEEPGAPPIQLASFGLLEPTWVFYGDRPITELAASGAAEWLGGWVEVAGRWKPKPPLGIRDIRAAEENWVIITTDEHHDRLRSLLPDDFQVLAHVPYFLKNQHVLLVGRSDEHRLASRQPRAE